MVKAIATTKFQDGGLPILSGDCYMHRQANFYAGLWPEGTDVAPDGDIWFFYLPSPADGPKYMLTAGDIYAAGTDKPETYDVIRYTGSADYSLAVANTRNEPSPNKNIDINAITDPYLKAVVGAAGDGRRGPLRRLRPDARRRRRRHAVDGDHGVGRRWRHPDLPRQRRSELARVLTLRISSLSSTIDEGGRGIAPAPFVVLRHYD